MLILMILPIYPIPTDSGTKRRMIAFLQGMSKHHQVVVASLGDIRHAKIWQNDDQVWKNYIIPHSFHKSVPVIRSFLSSKTYRVTKFASRKFKKLITKLLDENDFDVVWVNFLNMVTYLDKHLDKWSKSSHSKPVLLIDQHNVDEHVWRSFAIHTKNPFQKIFCNWEAVKNRKLQKLYFPYCDLILSVSELDKNMTEKYGVSPQDVILAPNGVDIKCFKPKPKSKSFANPTIVFGGSLDATMNQDAVQWFIKDIFPLVKKQIPEVKLLLVGRNPPASILAMANSNITVVANPLDIRDYYRQADVFVVPLRSGGGTKLKTLEAMAMALPVVSTSVGAQGLNVISGEHLFMADDRDIFADKVVEFLLNPEMAKEIAFNARKLVEENFSWETIVHNVETAITARLTGYV